MVTTQISTNEIKPNLPVNKCSLGIHEIKLVVQSGPGLGNGSCVGQHAHSTWYLHKYAQFKRKSNLPVDKSSLGIHEVKLVVQPSPGLSYSCSVA